MRKLFRTLALCLIAALLLAFLPVVSAYALPHSFNRARADKYAGKKVLLTIGDMKFNGRIGNSALTDAELEKLVKELMEKMNMTEQEFEQLNMQVNALQKMLDKEFTEQDWARIRSNWYDMFGVVPVIGDAASFIQFFDQLYSNEHADAMITGYEYGGGKIPIPGTDGSMSAGTPYSAGKALLTIAREWTRNQQQYQRMVNGLNAQRRLNNFYSLLDGEIMDFFLKNKDKIVLEFKNATDQKQFSLYGTQNTEKWTLNMTLWKISGAVSEKAPTMTQLYSGKYQGDFTIDIHYDLGGFQSGIDQAVWQIPGLGDGWRNSEAMMQPLGGVLNVRPITPPSTCEASRTIEGKATAQVKVDGVSTIDPSQSKDEKNATVSEIEVKWTWEMFIGDSHIVMSDITYKLSADKDSFIGTVEAQHLEGTDTNSYGYGYGYADIPYAISGDIPWDEDIWRRGDSGAQWKLQILPR